MRRSTLCPSRWRVGVVVCFAPAACEAGEDNGAPAADGGMSSSDGAVDPTEGRDGGAVDGGRADGGHPDGDGGGDGGTMEEEPIGSVTVSPMQGDLVEEGTAPLRATVRDEHGEIVSGHSISWQSMAPEIADVDAATGIVTGVSPGTAYIAATSGGKQGLVQVTVLEAITDAQLAAGNLQVCGLSRAGRVYCWTREEVAPKLASETLRFTSLVAGGEIFVALTPEGTAYTWGQGAYGDLGTGETMPFHEQPQPVVGDHTFRSITAGGAYVVALTAEGEAYAWGHNAYGSLGNGSTSDSSIPVRVATSARFTQVSAWHHHTLALTADGEVYSWGESGHHLGVLTDDHQLTPIAIPTSLRFASVQAGQSASYALTADGEAYGWGNFEEEPMADLHVPRPLSAGKKFRSMPAPGLAIDDEGKLHGWGPNRFGEVGDGTYEKRTQPVPIDGDYEFGVITKNKSGYDYVRALHADGLLGWGCPISYAGGTPPPQEEVDASPHVVASTKGRLIVPETITLVRGGTTRVPVSIVLAPGDFDENGPVYDSGPVPLSVNPASDLPSGVTVRLESETIPTAQTSTVLVIDVAADAPLGDMNWISVEFNGASGAAEPQLAIVPPAPPSGTPLDIRCDAPDSVVYGYSCLTNSGGATAPHKWIDLPVAGTTWNYENVCISYGAGGRGQARFRNPSGTITTHALRFGVLSRSSGTPEVTTSGHWLLYNEGIGDPQVEQLTYNPGNQQVGEAWPFVSGACPF